MESVTSNYIKKLSFLILVSICLGKTVEGASMSLFSKEKHEVVVSSPFEGVITYKGKPAAGAKVERTLKWKDEDGEKDSVETDLDGRFFLPIVEDTVSLSPITQFVMGQEIKVYFNNEEYLIWTIGKDSRVIYGELGGVPKNLRCELTDELVAVDVEDALLGTSCKWDAINKENQEVLSSNSKAT